jgi:hypothetical protein
MSGDFDPMTQEAVGVQEEGTERPKETSREGRVRRKASRHRERTGSGPSTEEIGTRELHDVVTRNHREQRGRETKNHAELLDMIKNMAGEIASLKGTARPTEARPGSVIPARDPTILIPPNQR